MDIQTFPIFDFFTIPQPITTSSCNKTDGLRPHDKWFMREGGVVQQAPKIVYKLVLLVGAINVSCWNLKCVTNENRANGKVIFILIGWADCFGIIQDHFCIRWEVSVFS